MRKNHLPEIKQKNSFITDEFEMHKETFRSVHTAKLITKIENMQKISNELTSDNHFGEIWVELILLFIIAPVQNYMN